MKIVACLLALTAVTSADPQPQPTEAFVATPIESAGGGSRVALMLAPVVESTPQALIVDGRSHRVEVPRAFVGPALVPAKLKVGAYVLFQETATLTTSLAVGRVTKVGKDSYTIAYDAGDTFSEAGNVPATHVLPLDGKLHFGEPVAIDGGTVLAWYVASPQAQQDEAARLAGALAGSDRPKSWVVSDGELVESRDVMPLRIAAFKKGAKVLVRGRPVVVVGGRGHLPLERATVVAVRDGGLTYEARLDEGDELGFTRHVSADAVFAR